MAHFAKLDLNDTVIAVHVVNNSDILDAQGQESEAVGIAFLTNWSGGHTNWKQTSYHGNFRKNYAGIGYQYDRDRDAFIPPKPYPSWVLDEATCHWQAPIPLPDTENRYVWDEALLNWRLV